MPENREVNYAPEISHGEIAPEAGGNVEVLPEVAAKRAPEAASEPMKPKAAEALPVKPVVPSAVPNRTLSPMGQEIEALRDFDSSPKNIDSISSLEDRINAAREDVLRKFFEKGEAD